MPSLFEMRQEEKTAAEREDWKEDCCFCRRADNCPHKFVSSKDYCPLDQGEEPESEEGSK